MRGRGRAAAGVLAAGMALTLVAAEAAPASDPVGTATTSLFGADVTVSHLGDDLSARLMELSTLATTDGVPFAQTSIVPLRLIDGSTVGESEARSDGQTSSSSTAADFGDPLGLLGLGVQPVDSSAQATATGAMAFIEAAVADLAALGGALGLDIVAPGAMSAVGGTQAVATQGIEVSELGLGLGALDLTADILGQLGVDQVVALLEGLGIGDVSVDEVTGAIDTILGLQGAAASEVALVDGLSASIDDTLAELVALDGLLDAVSSLSLLDLLTNLGLVADLIALDCDPGAATLIDDVIECVEGVITGVVGELGGDLGDLAGIVATLEGILDDLADALVGLDGLLDLVNGLLDQLANAPLVGVGAFDVGVVAQAASSLDDSSATVLCAPVDVLVLTQVISTPDCAEGLSAITDVTALVSGAVGTLTDLLAGALPIDGLDGLRVDVFSNLVQSVEEVDGVITSTAGLDLLDLVIPSLTLDPSLVTDLLDGLGLVDVLGPLQELVATVDATLDGLTAITGLLGDVTTTVDELVASVDPTGVLADLVDEVTDLIDGLLALDFGSLSEAVSTPGLSLVIDPVSEATFQAADTTPTPAPTPAPTPEVPAMPHTGGGLALLGLMALGGAAASMRRR